MPKPADFQMIFDQLRPILQAYESNLVVEADAPGNYSLNTPYSAKYKKEVFFGAVQIRKNYVSFHLMPVYIVVIVLIVAWRWEWVGAVLFTLLAAFYVVQAWGRFHWSAYAVISGPLVLLGVLFLFNWIYRAQLRTPQGNP